MKKNKKKYYAIVRGRIPGTYDNWEEAEKQVKGFSGSHYKGFTSYDEAINYFQKAPKEESNDKVLSSENENPAFELLGSNAEEENDNLPF